LLRAYQRELRNDVASRRQEEGIVSRMGAAESTRCVAELHLSPFPPNDKNSPNIIPTRRQLSRRVIERLAASRRAAPRVDGISRLNKLSP